MEKISKYLEFKKDEIRLKNSNFEKPRKWEPDNGPKNTHIKFQNDRSTGTLSKIGGTKMLEDRKVGTNF